MQLPTQLEAYREKIERTMEPVVDIMLSRDEPNRFSSKVGGEPYFVKGESYPTGEDGVPLRLLAQINFAEVPHLPDFPTKGILQFYIHPSDDVMGLDFENAQSQKDFRVLYHENLIDDESKLLNDFSFLTEIEEEYGPFDFTQSYSMTFEKEQAPMSVGDFRFGETIGIDYESDEGDELMEAYYETFSSQGHKIGGYPFFTQTDPREYGDYQEQLILLFQMDTDDDFHIMWGDCGVANFFISKEDLLNLRFDRVLYNWDCC